jgi:ribosome-associated protein
MLACAQEAIFSLKAVSPIVLDMREVTVITDYFLICNGTSSVHIRGIADQVMDDLEKQGVRPRGKEGYPGSTWVLLDYGDLVVHIFLEEQREFYSLERLWSDAHLVELSPPEETASE